VLLRIVGIKDSREFDHMTDRRGFLSIAALGSTAAALIGWRASPATAKEKFELELNDAQWKAKLSPAA
jgi:peptide-methionine (R)-S-oxide reductase